MSEGIKTAEEKAAEARRGPRRQHGPMGMGGTGEKALNFWPSAKRLIGLLGPDLARLAALGGFGRLGPRIARYLPDERLQRIFSFQALYAGVPPARALGAYAMIAYMDTIAGVHFPRGGMRRVGEALAGAAAAPAGLRAGAAGWGAGGASGSTPLMTGVWRLVGSCERRVTVVSSAISSASW